MAVTKKLSRTLSVPIDPEMEAQLREAAAEQQFKNVPSLVRHAIQAHLVGTNAAQAIAGMEARLTNLLHAIECQQDATLKTLLLRSAPAAKEEAQARILEAQSTYWKTVKKIAAQMATKDDYGRRVPITAGTAGAHDGDAARSADAPAGQPAQAEPAEAWSDPQRAE